MSSRSGDSKGQLGMEHHLLAPLGRFSRAGLSKAGSRDAE